MITKFTVNERGELIKSTAVSLSQALWIDVFNPNANEREMLEREASIVLPLHHEIHQLEFSNRFYLENGSLYFSIPVITKAAPVPESHIVIISINQRSCVTLRYSDPNPIGNFIKKIDQQSYPIKSHLDIFHLILEVIVGALADTFELIEAKSDELGLVLIGSINNHGSAPKPNLNKKLRQINYLQNLLSKSHQSLSNLNLLLAYFFEMKSRLFNGMEIPDFSTLKEDIQHLSKHGEHLAQKMGFQLQSSLGLINIEQTHIIKIFTVLAMIFMPPTLIASIYGMNFRNIPELSTTYGYPIVVAIMLISAFVPYRFFKFKGWI